MTSQFEHEYQNNISRLLQATYI